MEDAKKATKLTEVEALKLQNVGLRLAMVTQERETLAKELMLKYGSEGERLNIDGEGNILRAPTPLVAVPEGA